MQRTREIIDGWRELMATSLKMAVSISADRQRPGGGADEHYCEVGSRTSSGLPSHRDAT
jgi:hypothetical protein